MATLSSIITPTNITTASNTQTLTNKTITGGILNGTLGATTPSTIAATTITATGTITSTGQGLILSHANPRIDFIGSAASQTWYLGDGVGGTNGNFILRDGTNSTNAITVAQGTRAMTLNGAVSVSGLLTTSAGVTNTAVSIKSTKTYGPVYEATEDNTDNTGRGIFNIYRSTTLVGQIVTTNTTCAYNNVSDYRLKEITGPLVDSGTFIDALKPKVGTWKLDGSKFVGFLAHEFAEVSPISVTGEKDAVDSDGKPINQSMQASTPEVMANIIAELQSLRKRLAVLESK